MTDANVDMESPGKYDVQVSDYFYNLRFFCGSEWRRDRFKASLKDDENDSQILDLRDKTAGEFYTKAYGLWKDDDKDLKFFFVENIDKCDAAAVLEDFYEWKKATGARSIDDWVVNIDRMVKVDYRIEDTDLAHTHDLNCFSERVENLFEWWDEKVAENKYVGPYLCMVQSSGMGKTKLMYEYRKAMQVPDEVKTRNKPVALLILPTLYSEVKQLFDYQFDLEDEIKDIDEQAKDAARQAADKVHKKLDDILRHENVMGCQKIVLLFDESHFLLKKKFGCDAFFFRCVRLWLRQKRFIKKSVQKIVGVFAGTNSTLSNFLIGSDNQCAPRDTFTRDNLLRTRKHYEKGAKFNPPFYQITTIGCRLDLMPTDPNASEYARAVYYGRPLFAAMAEDGILDDNSSTVLARMLLLEQNRTEWEKNRNTLINLLSTRLQMGQTSKSVTCNLVAKGYANLSGYFEESVAAQLAYIPDPVCARLAMCMMDEGFQCSLNGSGSAAGVNILGKNKRWWTGKLEEIFSSGIVSPEKGDFGQVMVALYILFCADLLRKRSNGNKVVTLRDYTEFSVSLDEWLHIAKLGGNVSETPSETGNACKVSVGSIQVCRNSLRSYGDSWKCLANQSFLKHVYESGTAFYVYPGCPLIDLVIPLRVEAGKKVEFVPMLVSIKCRTSFNETEAADACNKMTVRAENDKLKKALCLLVVLGSTPIRKSSSTGKSKSRSPPTSDIPVFRRISQELIDGVVSEVVRVPHNDVFGLSKAFNAMAPTAQVHAELYASHPFLMAHGGDDELLASKAMRATSSRRFVEQYNNLRKAVTAKKIYKRKKSEDKIALHKRKKMK